MSNPVESANLVAVTPSRQLRLVGYAAWLKSQRTAVPLSRSSGLPGLTSVALKFALRALSASPELAELDHKLPLSPWPSKPSFQLPA